MHYALLVIGGTGSQQELEDRLTPYDKQGEFTPICSVEGALGYINKEIMSKLQDDTEFDNNLRAEYEAYIADGNYAQLLDEWDVIKIHEGNFGHWDNPNGKWDWWEIGGHWAGFLGRGRNSAKVKTVKWDDKTTDAILTVDGEWLESEAWDGKDFIKNENWDKKFRELIASLDPETIVTIVDIHN